MLHACVSRAESAGKHAFLIEQLRVRVRCPISHVTLQVLQEAKFDHSPVSIGPYEVLGGARLPQGCISHLRVSQRIR